MNNKSHDDLSPAFMNVKKSYIFAGPGCDCSRVCIRKYKYTRCIHSFGDLSTAISRELVECSLGIFVLDDVKDFVCFLSFAMLFFLCVWDNRMHLKGAIWGCAIINHARRANYMWTVMTIELLLESFLMFTVWAECRLSWQIKETDRNKESKNKQRKNVSR